MDLSIKKMIDELKITIPILHIKNELYLIGPNRMNCDLKNDLMVRVGGGYERFCEYIPKNHSYFERSLVVHMIKSGESLEMVVDALFNGKKMKNILIKSPEKSARDLRLSSMRSSPIASGSKSPSKSRPHSKGFSFREVSPYSKTKSSSRYFCKSPVSKEEQNLDMVVNADLTPGKASMSSNFRYTVMDPEYKEKRETIVCSLQKLRDGKLVKDINIPDECCAECCPNQDIDEFLYQQDCCN